MRIIVSGGWSYGNIGDEAIARCTQGLLNNTFPDSDKVYLSYDVEDFWLHHNIKAEESVHSILESQGINTLDQIEDIIFEPQKYGLERYVKLFEKNTLFLMSGGGYFDGNWTSQFIARIVEIELAYKSKAKIAIIGQSIGPFIDENQTKIMKMALPHCNYINVRDDASYDFLKEMLPEMDLKKSGDIAITISDFYVPKRMKNLNDSVNVVLQIYDRYKKNGIYKINPKMEKIYKRITLKLYFYNLHIYKLLRLISKEKKINIVQNIRPTRKCKNEHYLKYAEQIRSVVGYNKITIKKAMTISELCDILANGSTTISVKMHPLIISASYGVPIVAISQHYKIDGFMKWIGGICMKNSAFSPKKIYKLLQECESNKNIIKNRKKEIYQVFEELKLSLEEKGN